MFNWVKRFLIAATAILALSAPSAAFGYIRVMSSGPSSGQTHAVIAPPALRTAASSPQGFQWGDAGVGAAGVIVLLGAGAGVASAMRHRRVHRPIVG